MVRSAKWSADNRRPMSFIGGILWPVGLPIAILLVTFQKIDDWAAELSRDK